MKTSEIGKQSGYLVSFQSEEVVIKQNVISFIAKLAINLAKKPKAKKSKAFKDPFMPPFDVGAHVCDLKDGEYRILLNKFNVVPNHLLIVTSEFVQQSLPLNNNDFEVALQVIASMDGLCYFNSGPFSGASQPHKHLQIIPRNRAFPIEDFIKNIREKRKRDAEEKEQENDEDIKLYALEEYAFVHSVYLLEDESDYDKMYKAYRLMMDKIKTEVKLHKDEELSYNLMMTADFMFVVGRSMDSYFDEMAFGKDVSLSVNAVTFAGTFFCKSQLSLDMLKSAGPLKVLQAVTFEQD